MRQVLRMNGSPGVLGLIGENGATRLGVWCFLWGESTGGSNHGRSEEMRAHWMYLYGRRR
jgi:hypothetical protein